MFSGLIFFVRRIFFILLPILLLAYIFVCFYMFMVQRSLQYFPPSEIISPDISGLSEEFIETADGERLFALYIPPSDEDVPVILIFHGNGGAGEFSHNRLSFFSGLGYGVLLPYYRGYGRSSGSPTESGLIMDGLTSFDFLLSRGISSDRIILVGESLGSAVAVRVGALRDERAVILEGGFSSAADIASYRYPLLPVSLLMLDQYHSLDYIGSIDSPLLMFHGTSDRVVPFRFGRLLYDRASFPKRFVSVEDASHGLTFSPRQWSQADDFIRGLFLSE